MRPPLRSMEPSRDGVTICTRADDFSASSREREGAVAFCPTAGAPVEGVGTAGAFATFGGLSDDEVLLFCASSFSLNSWRACWCWISGRAKKYCQPMSTRIDKATANIRLFWSFGLLGELIKSSGQRRR